MHKAKPDWLKIKVTGGENRKRVEEIVSRLSLHTVCEEANCPNLMECFCKKTATFMILGNICTRKCTFCNVSKGTTLPIDQNEPSHIATAVKELGLRHVVITSVTRDDLTDGGAGQFANVINEIRNFDRRVTIEVLIPDFQGCLDALKIVIAAKPDIINHNIETVPRLYPSIRPAAVYNRSLELLKNVKEIDPSILTKSGIMVGLGELHEEVVAVFKDLRMNGCDMLTIGQYLAPSKDHHPVYEYIHPEVFDQYRQRGEEMGFHHVASGPFVRSSYMAEKAIL
ncbi:lipoic acid synthetase [Geosporobacter subterraneus DSM 17957]|uniref:Lipoyl synthase n=1 Tax=Geosporobacter subterraneus DSM 17957 TaxID=1121919 RepID=A0A1M6H407_9FIRM|nr:lipoyl synthase [Geosporobacter subterraneus]SHJ16957.1 lipoic acid synthetase [Geosporobacter subterraneus DSM 17957]